MKVYYSPSKGQKYTESYLESIGFSLTEEVLKNAGYFEVVNKIPPYDKLLQKIIPDNLIQEDNRFIQTFRVENLNNEELVPILEMYASERKKEARQEADNVASQYTGNASSTERMTFDQQRTEVEAWVLNPNAETPTIDKLAESRGISRIELLEKARVKIEEFKNKTLEIVGKQQGYEDRIKEIVNGDGLEREKILELRKLQFLYFSV